MSRSRKVLQQRRSTLTQWTWLKRHALPVRKLSQEIARQLHCLCIFAGHRHQKLLFGATDERAVAQPGV
jgi:hypothetical protein